MSTCMAAGPRPGVARADEPAAGRAASAWRPGTTGGGRGTVVVADADEDGRAARGTPLRDAGYEVLEAATGEETIRLAHARRPDAIVLGAVLRGVDGMRALEVLKQHPATAAVPVIVLSSASGDEHEPRARAAGCAAWLPMPCPPGRLLDTLRALGERRQAA